MLYGAFGRSLCTYAANSAVYRERPPAINEIKTEITTFITNILHADLQKWFENKLNGFRSV